MDSRKEAVQGQRVNTAGLIKELKTDSFVTGCRMAFGYGAGLPVLQIRNQRLCICIPYLKHKVTGEVDKTLVYPIRYTLTVELPTCRVVGFENLEYNPAFAGVDFTKPVGYFRHEGIRDLNRKQYMEKRKELMGLYDKIINALLFGDPLTAEEEMRFGRLLRLLAEPSLLPIYRKLDKDFYDKYLGA